VLAARQHHPAAVGWLMAAVAAGGLVGSLLWTWRPPPPERTPVVVMVALAGVGVPLALAAVTSSVVLVGALLALSGVALGPFTGALFTVRQRHAPEQVRGQVFTIGAGLKTTAAAAGAAVGGALAGLPTAAQFALVGAVPVLAGAAGLVGLRRSDQCAGSASARDAQRPVAHGRSAGSAAATATHSAPITKK
jgi:predicted MFS family arabinose efflux permease